MKRIIFSILLLMNLSTGFAQYDYLWKEGDSLYKLKQYTAAADKYLSVSSKMPHYINPKTWVYNAACCYALAADTKKAMKYLDEAVYTHQYKNFDGLLADKDFTSLHGSAYWKKLELYIQKEKIKLSDPGNAKLVTTDIHHFWTAYDAAAKDTPNRKQIFIDQYFNKASPGLQDYYSTKINSVDAFVSNQDKKKEFYKAIRPNTLAIDAMKDEIAGNMVKLKTLYDDAIFPNIYFVIGRWNSAGTASDNGMLIGVDQIVKSAGIPEHELNLWEKK